MSKVTILIGLPGCGKTTYLENNSMFFPGGFYDDFHGRAINDFTDLKSSLGYEAIKNALLEGKDCAISDIEYCREARLLKIEDELDKLGKEMNITVEMKKLYFENNPNACRHNVVHRFNTKSSRNYIEELKKIDDLSKIYQCPENSIPIKNCCTDQTVIKS